MAHEPVYDVMAGAAALAAALGPGWEARSRYTSLYSDRTRHLCFGRYGEDVSGRIELPAGDHAVSVEIRLHKRYAVDLARWLAHLRTPGPLDLDCLTIEVSRG